MPGNGDIFRARRAGDPIPHSAAYFNALSELVKKDRQGRVNGTVPDGKGRHDASIVLVKNATGSNVAQFGVLGITGPLLQPSTNLAGFKDRLVLSCGTPNEATNAGKFVIALEPMPNAAIGPAVVAGAVQVVVDVKSPGDQFADVANGDIAKLRSGPKGAAQILWLDSTAGGTSWAIVRLGGEPLPLIPVDLTYSTGSDGSTNSANAYTYVAKYPGTTNTLNGGTALTVSMQRFIGKALKAQHGDVAYSGTNLTIWWCDEMPNYTNKAVVTNVQCLSGTITATFDTILSNT